MSVVLIFLFNVIVIFFAFVEVLVSSTFHHVHSLCFGWSVYCHGLSGYVPTDGLGTLCGTVKNTIIDALFLLDD